MICFKITSNGCPSLSYMAKKNMGSMTAIMPSAARELFPVFRRRKYTGSPSAAAMEKQMSCLFVRLKSTLLFTLVRSLGTDIYAAKFSPFFVSYLALNTPFARLPVLKRVKQRRTV